MNELLRLSLTDLTRKIHERGASPVELMEAVLSRIDETNEDLNAVVAMRDREALMADASDAEDADADRDRRRGNRKKKRSRDS